MTVVELPAHLPAQPELGARLAAYRITSRVGRKKMKEASGNGLTEGRIHTIEKGGPLKTPEELQALLLMLQTLGVDLTAQQQLDVPASQPPRQPRADGAAPAPPTSTRNEVEKLRQRMLGAHANGDHKSPVLNCPACAATAAPVQQDNGGPIVILGADEEALFADPFDPATTDGLYVLSNGQAQTFKRCRRKWWLAFYRGLVPNGDDSTSARATGERVHRALAAWYTADPSQRVDPRQALERVLVEDWTKIATRFKEEIGDEWESDARVADVAHKFNGVSDLERAMVHGYVEWLEETGEDQGLTIVESEKIVRHALPLGDGRWIMLSGTLDARAVRQSDGTRLFLEHKTKKDAGQRAQATLHLDEQVLEYHLLEYLTSAEGDARCDGALYNVLRRVKRTERAKPPFYDRVEVPHSVAELESFKERLVGTAREIVDVIDRLDAGESPLSVVYPTPVEDRCNWDCEFFAVCSLFDDGSRVEDALAAHFHHEDPARRYMR